MNRPRTTDAPLAHLGEPLTRCRGTEACCEVLERLRAADRSRAEGFPAVADELRHTAERFATIHRAEHDAHHERHDGEYAS